jgi:hypothetical protein
MRVSRETDGRGCVPQSIERQFRVGEPAAAIQRGATNPEFALHSTRDRSSSGRSNGYPWKWKHPQTIADSILRTPRRLQSTEFREYVDTPGALVWSWIRVVQTQGVEGKCKNTENDGAVRESPVRFRVENHPSRVPIPGAWHQWLRKHDRNNIGQGLVLQNLTSR